MKTIYLSGRMKNMPDLNKAKFNEYETKLIKEGFRVFNPHTIKGQMSEIGYMGVNLNQISNSDAVYLIPGWEASKGVKMEVFFALMYGIPVYCAKSMNQISWTNIELNVQIKTS